MKELIEWTSLETGEEKSIELVGGKYVCNRCLNRDQTQFYKDQLGYYCLKCLIFGKSATYKKIIRKNLAGFCGEQYSLSKVIYLSDMQAKASKECLNAYSKNYDLLVFAVCGAGKTEIVYDVILKALNDRKMVCFATPRKDVVLELTPRFKRDFVNVKIVSLYSGSEDRNRCGNLYITTTHQLINFYHYFDLVILDEVDAFPYYNNKMLEGFIDKAKKKTAPIIYLTATPTKKLKRMMSSGQLKYFVIPARFHKHPIPVPKVFLTNKTTQHLDHKKVPKKILKWIESKKKINKQVFIFVPNVKCGEMLENILKCNYNCQFVHAEMKCRKEIINDFRQGKLQFIITTTILERGVTISNVDVCIIQADDPIFDERSIVQIVGRAGRDYKYPIADVVLFTDYYSKGIKDAIKHIKSMNQYALKKGLLTHE